jgi:WD40 repeat protein
VADGDEAHHAAVDQVATAGHVVVTRGWDFTARVWDSDSGKQLLKIPHRESVRAIALSPDGSQMVTAGDDDTVCLWDVASGRRIHKLPGHGTSGEAVGFTPDGKHFLSWGDDMELRKWAVATGKVVLAHLLHPRGVQMPDKRTELRSGPGVERGTFSPDGKMLVLMTRDACHVFDVATGKDLYQIDNTAGYMPSLAISPDGRLLLASAFGNYLRSDGIVSPYSMKNNALYLWELSTRQLRKQIPLSDGGAGPVAFSADGKLFAAATGEPDRRIRLFDRASGTEAGTFQGFRSTVRSLAFAPDGTRLISGMDDATALVWDLTASKK